MHSGTSSVLAEPLDAYVRRRARSALALSDGEATTAAVGLLRGCRGAGDQTRTVCWWLTAEGRPTMIDDEDGSDPLTATAECLQALTHLITAPATRALFDVARASILERRTDVSEDVEKRLFRHAPPRPLVLGPLAPVVEPVPTATTPHAPGEGLLALVDADLSDAIRSAARDLRDRLRASRALRLTLSALGGTAVAVVAVLAFSAPESGSSSASSVVESDAIASPVASTVETEPRVPLSDDVVEAARALLARASSCAVGEHCSSDVWEDGEQTGDALIPVDEATRIELIDDFGGVTVVRVGDPGTGQYVTLVSRNDRWLVRAVRTIADQPS
ncbi:hypothetical protein [Microbacterium trichothecenolyticum]|uniref:Uncharacterized protein n=1 Tax=Microbacterium trichothecenolyticum TaxID=69370 RepID=A0ABU0TTA0_MICTR|nr:hypothetical protein [Microbacterium trichothecenolyticum]MDQ1122177.1 hypothetical protein [Microbacterium trichothecenolyticum]